MAYFDTTWYVNFGDGSTTGYFAVAQRAPSTAVAAGAIRRQFTTPAVGSERCFVCTVAGTTSASADATWTLTRGAKSALDGTVQWQEITGQASLNGDLANTATWAQVKAATPAVLGQIIKRSNGASYQICTTAGAMSASEPAFSDTAGVTTTDTTAVWTSLGVVGNFTGGQAPFARLASVFGTNWFAAGSTVYVHGSHAETQDTSNSFTVVGSATTMGRIICHNGGAYPPAAGNLATTATISTGTSVLIQLTFGGSYYIYGITFRAGTATASAANVNFLGTASIQPWVLFENCSFQIHSTSTSSTGCFVQFGGSTSSDWFIATLKNCTVRFAHANNMIRTNYCQLTWRETGQILAAGSAVPVTLVQASTATVLNTVLLEGLDLSQLTGGLWSNATASTIGNVTVKDCKLNATTTVTTPINTGMTVQLVASAADATSYKSSRHTYQAVETTETSIVRSGGYADPQGQAQSRKIVTTANTQWLRPYAAQPLAVWNSVVGSLVTVTVYGTAAALPNNDDIWLEVSYLGSGSFPVGSVATSGKLNVWSTNAAVASDGSTWGGGAAPFKLVATLTPNMPGYLIPQVKVGKASATYYIDPLAVVT